MAGGWVRDKLLKQHSADVDVALDCMMKVQFARIVQRYMASSLSSSWSSSTGEEDDDEGGATTNEDDDDGGGEEASKNDGGSDGRDDGIPKSASSGPIRPSQSTSRPPR